jgi:hypothetical protein
MSIPAETPAAVTNLPSSTQRWRRYVAPKGPRTPEKNQLVVARRPSSRPTAARRRDPVHTDDRRHDLG